jgi:hypothetical protein
MPHLGGTARGDTIVWNAGTRCRIAAVATVLTAQVLCTFAAPLRAQEGATALTGTVVDTTYRPLPQVIVYVDTGLVLAQSDSNGQFRLSAVTPGPHRMHLRRNGWAPRSFELTVPVVTEDAVDLGAIALRPGPPATAHFAGTVRDATSGTPVVAAEVVLNGNVVATTDQGGRFRTDTTPIGWGSNLISVRRIGYAATFELLWVEESGTQYELGVTLRAVTVLPEVVVLGDRVVYEYGRMRGFWERRREGFGKFITREEIEQRDPHQTSDLLRTIPGMSVVWNPMTLSTELRNTRGASSCRPIVYVDGLPFLQSDDLNLDRYLIPDDIEGIEVYRGPAELPSQFNVIGTACGAVVIWTR